MKRVCRPATLLFVRTGRVECRPFGGEDNRVALRAEGFILVLIQLCSHRRIPTEDLR